MILLAEPDHCLIRSFGRLQGPLVFLLQFGRYTKRAAIPPNALTLGLDYCGGYDFTGQLMLIRGIYSRYAATLEAVTSISI